MVAVVKYVRTQMEKGRFADRRLDCVLLIT